MLYSAWDREINISLFFATFLYENEAPGLEQAAVVTMAERLALKCLHHPLCVSVNLAAEGDLWCELLSSDKYSNPNEYKEKKSSHHYFFEVRIFYDRLKITPWKAEKKIGVTKAVYSLYPIFCFILLSQV